MKKTFAVVLAAGRGTRMKSPLPKVLHVVGGLPLIAHSVKTALGVAAQDTVLVVPNDHTAIRACLGKKFPRTKIKYAVQKEPLGTGHALSMALLSIKASEGKVLVLNGDMPLIGSQTVKNLLSAFQTSGAVVALLTADAEGPTGFGRIVRDDDNRIRRIVEEKDADEMEKNIAEVNVGIYVFDLAFLKKNLSRLSRQNKQKEYYLTDLIAAACEQNRGVTSCGVTTETEILGVNSQADLQAVNSAFYRAQRSHFMSEGVTCLGNDIFIDADVIIGAGTFLESPCHVKQGSRIGAGVLIKAYSYLDGACVADHCQVGPFAHLRPGTELAEGVKVGNFVEVKKSRVGKGSKINHLSYVGDATIGRHVNIGAGTITCNYDGVHKHQTIIEDGVFVGSDTQFVAPVRIGKGALIGAGTTVTKNVKPCSLVISRVPQRELPLRQKHHKKSSS